MKAIQAEILSSSDIDVFLEWIGRKNFKKAEKAEKKQEENPSGPHCDCKESNEIYFGRKMSTYQGTSPDIAHYSVPTKIKNGSEDQCEHCGYTVFFIKTPSITLENKKRKNVGKRSKPVQGMNIKTGEVKTYESKFAASLENGSGIYVGLKTNKPVKGILWKYIEEEGEDALVTR